MFADTPASLQLIKPLRRTSVAGKLDDAASRMRRRCVATLQSSMLDSLLGAAVSALFLILIATTAGTAHLSQPSIFQLLIVVFLFTVVRKYADWLKRYRAAYHLLCSSMLPLRIADHEYWRALLIPGEDAATSASRLPGASMDALYLAARHFDELVYQPAGAATRKQPLLPTFTAMLGRTLSPVQSSRYAAIYDFFYDPQLEYEAAVGLEESAPSLQPATSA